MAIVMARVAWSLFCSILLFCNNRKAVNYSTLSCMMRAVRPNVVAVVVSHCASVRTQNSRSATVSKSGPVSCWVMAPPLTAIVDAWVPGSRAARTPGCSPPASYTRAQEKQKSGDKKSKETGKWWMNERFCHWYITALSNCWPHPHPQTHFATPSSRPQQFYIVTLYFLFS